MKKLKYLYIALITAMLVGSCKQELVVRQPPATTTPPTPSKGTLDFTKFVSIGNGLVAGMQAQALFNEGQANSMPRIIAKQLESVGGPTTFNQPDIGSVNGFNPISSVYASPVDQVPAFTLGRLILFDPDGPSGPRTAAPYPARFPGSTVTCPASVTTPPLPAPYNTADYPADFSGSKTTLNNYGVPLIYLVQTLAEATGGPNVPKNANPAYSVLFSRFAVVKSPSGAPGSGSTIIGDAKTAAGTFYLIWLGFEDVLLYAATGADGVTAGTFPMTASASFTGQYNAAIGALLAGTTFKGVVGNIPDFTSLPYFYTVPWNTITLDAASAASATTNLAVNYNAFLDGMVGASIITAGERDKRKLTYIAGKNGVLLSDDAVAPTSPISTPTTGLTDLSPYMTGPYTGLLPFKLARQATSTDLVPLAAGSILGTCFSGISTAVFGVSYPVSDQYILTPSETAAILTRTGEFNTAIAAAVAGSGGRLVLADVRTGYSDFVTAKAMVSDGVTIVPSFAPPAGAWSEDGIHPNNRGNAFTANIFIEAINTGFTGTVIPKAKLSSYTATKLPANP